RVDVVAAGPHLVEASRLHFPVLALAADHRIQPDLEEDLSIEVPDLVAFLRYDNTRRVRIELRGESSLEHVGWLDEMIVDREQGVTDLARLGIGLEPMGLALAPVEPDRVGHTDNRLRPARGRHTGDGRPPVVGCDLAFGAVDVN